MNRSANLNGTPRIMGGIALRNWFFKNFKPMDTVNVDVSSTEMIVLDGSRSHASPVRSGVIKPVR